MAKQKPMIVYIQYNNPAAYPPLLHSSKLMASNGNEVIFLASSCFGTEKLEVSPQEGISLKRIPSFGSGILLKINYLVFVVWCVIFCFLNRPKCIYASDLLACLPAFIIKKMCNTFTIYHEHDTPTVENTEALTYKILNRWRKNLARVADLCILPQDERLESFIRETERRKHSICVWNCPLKDEVVPMRPEIKSTEAVSFYYHGCINPQRIPLTTIDALANSGSNSTLTIVGYETIGSIGYVDEIKVRALKLGVDKRVFFPGPLSRGEIFDYAKKSHVGLAFMPAVSNDINMLKMVGASNKAFDYLAAGMALLVSDLADWQSFYVSAGYAIACNPSDLHDLSRAMRWCVEHPSEVYAMGDAGRRRIIEDWNYEKLFGKVTKLIS